MSNKNSKSSFGFIGSLASKLQHSAKKKEPNINEISESPFKRSVLESPFKHNSHTDVNKSMHHNLWSATETLTDKISPKLIESWIEEFLVEADKTKIPATLMKVEGKHPLAQ